MKKLLATLGLCVGVLAVPALAQAQTPQQSRMAQCNKEAVGKTGDARKAFMKECLAGKTEAGKGTAAMSASGKKLTPQQEKMSFCSKDAKAKGLKGADRKKFMSECLRKK